MRSQSRESVRPLSWSLATGRMFAVIAMGCEATCTPSMK
jgi:hypothetical protein